MTARIFRPAVISFLFGMTLIGCGKTVEKHTIKEVEKDVESESASYLAEYAAVEKKLQEFGCEFELSESFHSVAYKEFEVEFSCDESYSDESLFGAFERLRQSTHFINEAINLGKKISKAKDVSLTDKNLVEKKEVALQPAKKELEIEKQAVANEAASIELENLDQKLKEVAEAGCSILKKSISCKDKRKEKEFEVQTELLTDVVAICNSLLYYVKHEDNLDIGKKKIDEVRWLKQAALSNRKTVQSNIDALWNERMSLEDRISSTSGYSIDCWASDDGECVFILRLLENLFNGSEADLYRNKAIQGIDIRNASLKEVDIATAKSPSDFELRIPIGTTEADLKKILRRQPDSSAPQYTEFLEAQKNASKKISQIEKKNPNVDVRCNFTIAMGVCIEGLDSILDLQNKEPLLLSKGNRDFDFSIESHGSYQLSFHEDGDYKIYSYINLEELVAALKSL